MSQLLKALQEIGSISPETPMATIEHWLFTIDFETDLAMKTIEAGNAGKAVIVRELRRRREALEKLEGKTK